MKVAIVHDYIKDFGGAERVLRVLADLFPEAPIYTAFVVPGSDAAVEFADRKIVESCWAWLIRNWNLYSPLRFLVPAIWSSIDLSDYDLVITSCSSYFARGFKTSPRTKVVAYCHTPPRFLYGFETSISLMKYWPVKVYAIIVNHFLRKFDYDSAMRVDKWIVNSKNVQERVKKYYQKESEIVYPPVEVTKIVEESKKFERSDYFLIVSRLVGAKGLEQAAQACKKLKVKLKIAGGAIGFSDVENNLKKIGGETIELLGRVSEEDLYRLYAQAKGFIALARQEDFGMTVVEAQAAGTPVIAFNGGGFRETVIDSKTGILINETSEKAIEDGLTRFNKLKWNGKIIQENAKRFSKERFEVMIKKITAR